MKITNNQSSIRNILHNFWTKVYEEILLQGEACVLIVVAVKGSSPGKPGFKMAIFPDDKLIGSIGGGKLEFDLAETGKARLKSSIKSDVIEMIIKDHQPDSPRASGMSCAGSQTNLLLCLNSKHLPVLERITQSEKKMTNGSIVISEDGLKFNENNYHKDFELSVSADMKWLYRENLNRQKTVYIIGAGHIGLALSEVMKFLDFRVILFDHRTEINTLVKNSYHDELIIGPYEAIHHHIHDAQSAYVVIVSHSHESDQMVLDSLLEKELTYLGMMGSTAKVKKILQNIDYHSRTANKKLHIHSPIGLKINSISSKEIAISIAAEIISVKNIDVR